MERLAAPPMPGWLEKMAPFDRYAVRLAEADVHVMETGVGRDVLLLHGNPTWGFLYRRVAEALLGDSLRLVMPDLPGLGFSTKWTDPSMHTLDRHGRVMGELIRALGLRDAIFVGQDWGGAIGALAFADHAPEAMAGMVVLNTVLSPPRPGFRPTAFHRFARAPLVSDLVFRGLGFPQACLWVAQGDRRSIRGRTARAYRYPLRRWSENRAGLMLARMVPDSMEHPTVAPLRRVQAYVEGFGGPTAIVWGRRDPVLGGAFNWMKKLLPDAAVTETSAGHFLQEEVPDAIAAAIRDVAARIGKKG